MERLILLRYYEFIPMLVCLMIEIILLIKYYEIKNKVESENKNKNKN